MKQKLNLQYQKINWKELGSPYVIGVDEVGRGCLAGPVCAGAVLLNADFDEVELSDSKMLSEAQRLKLFPQIQSQTSAVGWATVEEITEFNILRATFLAMSRAVHKVVNELGDLPHEEILVVVDGHLKIPELKFKQMCVVKGDQRCAPISAASILAKVTRDEWMKEQSLNHPEYGFEKHKGYGTIIHRKAIEKNGPSKLHRPTFSGVKEWL